MTKEQLVDLMAAFSGLTKATVETALPEVDGAQPSAQ
jgi:hypothetical protein